MKAKKFSPKKRAAVDAKKAKGGGSGKKVNLAEIIERAKKAKLDHGLTNLLEVVCLVALQKSGGLATKARATSLCSSKRMLLAVFISGHMCEGGGWGMAVCFLRVFQSL